MNYLIIFVFFLISTQSTWADQKISDKEMFRPPMAEIKNAVSLVPVEYQKDVLWALRKSGRNGWEWIKAIENVKPSQGEGLAFLIANMPGRDLVALKSNFLIEDVDLAYQASKETPWGPVIPKDIFLNYVLPYASLNERRDDWRGDFYRRFIQIAKTSKTIDQSIQALNKYVFATFQVSYNAAKRPKPDQSPYESIEAHYASCTGLSILLTDALRSVGIPARIAAIAMWPDESGNHTWVEIWDGQWHYIGAAEPTPLDHTWFTVKASHADAHHPIYAESFKKTQRSFPMRWAPNLKFVPAIDVTKDYTH
jgi:transglutaminase-like putative cysteine protease